MWRVIDSIHADGLRNIAVAHAAARAEEWAAGVTPSEVVIDIDGTLLNTHSEKQDATPTYKRGFGFYPIVSYLDATGEALAGLLRSRAVGDQRRRQITFEVLDRSLAQLPVAPDDIEMLVRTDTAGATHDFVDGCRDRRVRFSIGLPVDQRVRDALCLAQEEDWRPTVETDGSAHDGAWVTELTGFIDHGWPEGTRVITRREHPHPGTQLTLFDMAEGFRHQVFITDQTDPDIATLELRHRHRAHVENRIRAAKDSGLGTCRASMSCATSTVAELVHYTRKTSSPGCKPCVSTVRYVSRNRNGSAIASSTQPPRIARTGGQTIVRFQRTWPWVIDIVTALAGGSPYAFPG